MKNKKLFAILTLVCFMMTLMPVAAFAGSYAGYAEDSYVYTADENASEKVVSEVSDKNNLSIKFAFSSNAGNATTDTVYVWFVKDGSNVPAASVRPATGFTVTSIPGVFAGKPAEGNEYKFGFENSGKYKVFAAFNDPSAVQNAGEKTTAEKIRDVEDKLDYVANHQSFEIKSSSSSSNYASSVDVVSKTPKEALVFVTGKPGDATTAGTGYYGNGVEYDGTDLGIKANNVADTEFEVKLVDDAGKAVKGQTVTFETNSANIELNKEKATTDQLGKVKFKLAGVRDGKYKVYVKAGSYEATILVKVGATGAQDIKVAKAPEAPFDVTSNLDDKIQFSFSDANGNAVTAEEAATEGADKAFDPDQEPAGYVAIVSQPSASKAENEDFYLVEADEDDNAYRANLKYNGDEDLAEGVYEIKVVLNNGKYVTVKFEVKEFKTPVSLKLTYNANAVELNSYVDIDDLDWVDENGVTKTCTNKVDLAATGYAVKNFVTSGTNAGRVYVKNDEKYVGSKITVIAVDDRYNLTAKAELTVADEASALAFDTKTLAINSNNKVGVAVVDSEGNKVALGRNHVNDSAITTTSALTLDNVAISYVVLDKPEGAKVSVTTDEADNKILTEGTFKMNVTANTVGNVTIQAVAKVTYANANADADQATVVKYYTGTQIFAVGKDSVGQVVVMSVNSNEIIVNDAKATIDAAPIVKNDRTFVPFRALAEAFNAEVAFDEATQAVTAELNGVKVVMTIGSATYTVNGAEKTMDVAPFINGSRTMVPVRFVAEAFGIKVIPTYDENGATADILFNL